MSRESNDQKFKRLLDVPFRRRRTTIMTDNAKKFAQLIAQADQACKLMVDGVVPQLWTFYEALLKQGFSAEQAMAFTLRFFDGLFRMKKDEGKK